MVLNQDVSLAKAGSSAHNLFLQIAVEVGLIGFGLFLVILFETVRNAWKAFTCGNTVFIRVFAWTALLSFVWVLGYSMTDAALFDGRVFLLFVGLLAMIRAASDKTS